MMKLSICAVLIVTLALALAATPDMYWPWPGEPTLADVDYFNRTSDAQFVIEAIKAGVDQDFVIKLAHLGSMRSRKQRLQILETLKELHSIDIVKEYLDRGVFDSDVGVLNRALFLPRAEFLAREVRWAIDGVGTDENTLTDIFCCLDPKEVAYTDIEKAYERLYEEGNLSDDVSKDVSGPYESLLSGLMRTRNNITNATKAQLIADTYFNTDTNTSQILKMEEQYKSFFSLSSYDEIRQTSRYFHSGCHVTLLCYLSQITTYSNYGFFTINYWWLYFAGENFRDLVLSTIQYSSDKIGYYTDLIAKGFKQRDFRRLIRAVAIRADFDLEEVKFRYIKEHSLKENLVKAVMSYHRRTGPSDRIVLDYVRLLLIKILCGNRDPSREIELIQLKDKSKRCSNDDIECGFGKMCYDTPDHYVA
ncbi:unnamed protein product [Orchesella dallaii]|uniref:Uncharacterized protein n=1 Tax=Orchesella dallaii TaxID=48710 RepID=A0ABP1RKA7_9HEXA